MNKLTAEHRRLEETQAGGRWKMWGPYLSERQWGTVREDYSPNGAAWDYFSHDQARSRAYRWGEDGIAGYSDEKQRLCFAVALWNGVDPILKERLFGLTNSEGNHGEDVKEYYYYLDSTPTHSYMKYLYKYPQRAYPYESLVITNRSRSRYQQEYELVDTGVFDDDRYFDVFVEYAKAGPEDIAIRITVTNRGPDDAPLHVLPTLWFRNTWSWNPRGNKPSLQGSRIGSTNLMSATHPELGEYRLYCDSAQELLFTENETNSERIFGVSNAGPYVKDGIDNYVVHGLRAAVNPSQTGTKASAHCRVTVAGGATVNIDLRLCKADGKGAAVSFGESTETVIQNRRREADEFYDAVIPPAA
ncbi:MAG TPA: glucosidase, partial [Bryobacteraceae bacterium]